MMTTDKSARSAIQKTFGEQSYIEGKLNRPYLASQVFSTEKNQRAMNVIVHPIVEKHFQKWVRENASAPYLMKESALLSNSFVGIELDKRILVTAPEEVRIRRILKRDNRSLEEIRKIMERQQQPVKADYTLFNDELQLLVPQAEELHLLFTKLAKEKKPAA
ncbi:MAG: dephospho-CoA kinase [Candidatus Nephrothrix sp. EaCA]|nr:MAG: dephospho-CoA kinase [Candidatus Nephrothrix sp. EaCA]